jgi:pyruvate-ferredoxin/flavodoxin oxidoreductase
VQAFQEAEAFPGPSLIIAYSHCIAHGYDMAHGVDQQKLAADTGVWPLFRFDPRKVSLGEPPLHLDSGPPKADLLTYLRNENRFRIVEKQDPERFRRLAAAAKEAARRRLSVYEQLATLTVPVPAAPRPASEPAVETVVASSKEA